MAEGDGHGTGPRAFDLEATDGNATGRGIIVTATSLRWSGGECPFDDIIAVELLCDTSEALIASCAILRTDQSRLLVELTGKPRGEAAIYRNFVQSFAAELGPAHRARIAFRPISHGDVPAIVWGALLMGGIVMMIWALATNQIAAAPENRLIIPTVGLLVPLFALALWRSLHRPVPKPLDPDNLKGSLPPTYYDSL